MLQNWSISPITGLIHARMDDTGNYNPSPNPFGAAGRDIALTVKQTEPLYWLCRMILLLRQRNATVPTPVLDGTRRLAAALYKIYDDTADLGFAVNVSSGTMAMGGSTGGALGPGAFALASQVFGLDEEASPDAIEIYVHRLRKKLDGQPVAIVTFRGLGYLLESRDA